MELLILIGFVAICVLFVMLMKFIAAMTSGSAEAVVPNRMPATVSKGGSIKQITTGAGLKATIDPSGSFAGIKPSKLYEATGLRSYFAADVALMEPESVEEAFEALMECYGAGFGQDGTGWGTVEDMVFTSENEDDPDMKPIVAFHLTEEIEFLVYEYAICAVTDGVRTMMMRMD